MLVIKTGENGMILFISEPFQLHKMHNCVMPMYLVNYQSGAWSSWSDADISGLISDQAYCVFIVYQQ